MHIETDLMEAHPRNPTVKKYLTGPYGSHYPAPIGLQLAISTWTISWKGTRNGGRILPLEENGLIPEAVKPEGMFNLKTVPLC